MEQHRPKSEGELDDLLSDLHRIILGGNYFRALEMCDWLIDDCKTSIVGHRERAVVKELIGELDAAISDLQFVAQSGTNEPADFHALGLLLLKRGDSVEAISKFTQAIQCGQERDFHYYTNSSRLLRAQASLKIGDYESAIEDASSVPIGYAVYFPGDGMRSSDEIKVEAEYALTRKKKSRFKFNKDVQ